MNIRSLKNVLRVTEKGSLTAAAAEAHLTVQAIAAQLNKIEDGFGFALFQRTPKGMKLTEEGQMLMPRIRKLIAASISLNEGVAELRGKASKQLRIAMNSTLTQDSMSRLLERLMAVFSGFEIQFSAGESHENLRNLREKTVDLAVFLGSPAIDLPFVDLQDFRINIVGASTKGDAIRRAAQRADRFIVRPDRHCPYSAGFDRLVEHSLPDLDPDDIEKRTIMSSSEHLTTTLIRRFDGVGILSRDVAQQNNLTILPDFEVALPVRVAVDATKFEGILGKRLSSLGTARWQAETSAAEAAFA